jgi:uncharacterized protein (DUF302 family)
MGRGLIFPSRQIGKIAHGHIRRFALSLYSLIGHNLSEYLEQPKGEKMTHPLTFQISLSDPFGTTVEKVTAALNGEGFGVLTSIDVKDTLKKKLDADFRRYIILGACNPSLAYQALQSEPLVGLLLPCNVTVEETDDGSLVSIINPDAMLGVSQLADNEQIEKVAAEARQRLERVAKMLEF